MPDYSRLDVKTGEVTTGEATGVEVLTTEQIAANDIRAIIPSLDFIDRFTDAELTAIRDAAATDVVVWKWVNKATSAAGTIDLGSPNTQAGMQILVDKGLITAERKTEILTP